jgi:hypothetical protein
MNEQEIQPLIEQLRDFRLRSRAASRLVALGRDAAPALLEALKEEGHEGARWAILNCLGEMGSPWAVPALARYLEDPNYQTVAHEALVRIAGRDLGPLPDEWLRWARQFAPGPDDPTVADLEALTNGKLVELAIGDSVATFREDEPNRFKVGLSLSGNRVQEVTVVFGSTDHEGAEIAIVYSNCGPANPEDYEAALRRNLHMPYGAIALRDIGGRPCFVMFNTILRHGLSPIELRKSIFAVGERAARVQSHFRE